MKKQVAKLRHLLSPNNDIQLILLRQIVPKLQASNLKKPKMVRLGDAIVNERSDTFHQEDFFVLYTTLVQLQKILEAVTDRKISSDVRPLLKRNLAHNLSLVKLLFQYIVKSEKRPDKKLKIEDSQTFLKHYQPLKEIFPFL